MGRVMGLNWIAITVPKKQWTSGLLKLSTKQSYSSNACDLCTETTTAWNWNANVLSRNMFTTGLSALRMSQQIAKQSLAESWSFTCTGITPVLRPLSCHNDRSSAVVNVVSTEYSAWLWAPQLDVRDYERTLEVLGVDDCEALRRLYSA